jgi:hypothetical protein
LKLIKPIKISNENRTWYTSNS